MRIPQSALPILIEQEIYFIDEYKLRSAPRYAGGITRSLDGVQSLKCDCTLFSTYERDYCQSKPVPLLSIAGLWCAKQALAKTLIGRLNFDQFTYLDIEIRHHDSGQPRAILYNSLAEWFEQQNLAIEVSISHTKTLAAAIILLYPN